MHHEVKLAFKHSMPVVAGYIPVAMAFGVLAEKYIGLHSILMSATVFAGASQFVALQMIMTLASPFFIIFTVFLINLRHILMSSYISVYHSEQSLVKKCLIAFGLTDETFAISSKELKEINNRFGYQITLNTVCYSSWILGTLMGVFIGQILPSGLIGVLPFTLTALFLYLLVVNVNNKIDVFVAILAGLISLVFSSVLVGWNILIATIIACFAGRELEKRREKRRKAKGRVE
jgi:4-azaleucine resistance transporter AzlC